MVRRKQGLAQVCHGLTLLLYVIASLGAKRFENNKMKISPVNRMHDPVTS
jgi:hypothetical protein